MSESLFSVRGIWRALTPADRLVAAGLLVLSIALAAGRGFSGTAPTFATVTVGREEITRLPLFRPGRFTFTGKTGPVVVEVRNAAVRVAESSCPHHLCVATGWRRRSGDVIACVPNALVVRLTGGTTPADAPDAVTR
jgi:hypothetical protein